MQPHASNELTAHSGSVLRANFETARVESHDLALEIVGIVERVVSDVDVAREGKGKLAMSKEA